MRLLGLDRAEEVVQEAFAAALVQWPVEGIPDVPRAWLLRTARHKAIDGIRRRTRFEEKQSELEDLARLERQLEPAPDEDEEMLRDDLLRLVFTCCHPSLNAEAQVALTLRTVCGLTTDEIARMFLTTSATMAQRIVRAKNKISAAKIPYRIPSAEELPARLDAVLATIYLVFTEGYAATGGDRLVRAELCREAIRLALLVCDLLPEESEAKGLSALVLLHDARRETRIDAAGDLVLLEEQDRSRWDRAQIAQGLALVDEAFRARPGPYAIQAAIAALHARAERASDTDWPQIAGLYHVLALRAPSPVVELNRAVAIAMAGDLAQGLRLIDALDARGSLPRYHLLPSARADLLRRLGRVGEAREDYRRALALVTNDVERRFLERRLRELAD